VAKTITASVGRLGGVNRPADVRTVQELLNKVPADSGGPRVKLPVDGVCGTSTGDAIRTFQVRQFGGGMADGRVDPGGPTLRKLNEYDTPGPPAGGVGQVYGEVAFFIGSVTIYDSTTPGGTPVRVGTPVRIGNVILTSKDSDVVEVRFRAGFQVSLTGRVLFVLNPVPAT
jgi:peptidoglycan hydrolase-like protein with peptidoglycan-binding domain